MIIFPTPWRQAEACRTSIPVKRCPQCNRVENDEALGFCRSDGTALVRQEAVGRIAHTALGDKEAAIAMLEKDVEERSSYVVTIGVELALDELRDDPRFKAMLKRLNLPE